MKAVLVVHNLRIRNKSFLPVVFSDAGVLNPINLPNWDRSGGREGRKGRQKETERKADETISSGIQKMKRQSGQDFVEKNYKRDKVERINAIHKQTLSLMAFSGKLSSAWLPLLYQKIPLIKSRITINCGTNLCICSFRIKPDPRSPRLSCVRLCRGRAVKHGRHVPVALFAAYFAGSIHTASLF